MEKIDKLLKQWEDIEQAYLELKTKRDSIETEIYTMMRDNIWRDYTTDSGIHASVIENEIKDIDWNGLSILLSETDIKSVTRYSVHKKLLIMTPDGRKRLRSLIKQGR